MDILVVSPEAGNWRKTSPLATAVNRMTDAFASAGTKVLTCSPFFKNLMVDVGSYHCVYTGVEKLQNKPYEIWVSDNPVEEIQKIVVSIKELREDYDLAWKNFAILVRYNRQRLYYEEALREAQLPIAGTEMENGELLEDGIHVETVHASKGLQYAVVYYAGMSEGLTPGTCTGTREQRKKQLDEERRLFYVGVTRAESFLVLLYCKRRYWKGRLAKLKRSRFLPKENLKTEIDMPVILFRIYAAARILLFMLEYIVKIAFMYVFRRKDLDPWLEEKIQKFSWFCMRMIRVDLTIEDQAQLAKVDWNRPDS